jgi:hypothetical protein
MSWNSGACEPGGDERANLTRQEWQAVLDALDGDTSRRDEAYDALNRSAPAAWLDD